jgi:hypothetical protein
MKLGAFNQFNKLRRRKNDIRIDADKNIIVLTIERLLILATTNIEAKRLHARKRHKGTLTRADDNVITVRGNKDVKRLCPRNKKGLAEMVTRKSNNHTGLLLLCCGLDCLGWVNYLVRLGHFYMFVETNL